MMLEQILGVLDFELPGLAQDAERAATANKSIKLLRNKSTTLARINVLPSELFTRIFELSCRSRKNLCKVDRLSTSPRTLACVDTYWRQLTLSDSYLWTRINLESLNKLSSKPHESTQTQLAYAKNLPLDVILDSHHFDYRELMDLHVDLIPRFHSFAYHLEQSVGYLPHDFLHHWIRHGTLGSSTALKLLSHKPDQTHDLRLELMQSYSLSMERIEAFLAPVQYLALHYYYFGWSSALYHNLTELDLCFDLSFVNFPTASEFAAILSASPGLRALKLLGFGLWLPSSSGEVGPIRLDHLETLFLKDIHRRSIRPLLTMLQPGSNPLYLRFDAPRRSVDMLNYVQLLRRSRVTKLAILGNREHPPQSLLASLAGLQHLLLYNFIIDIPFWESMRESLIPYANERHPSMWPSLRTLHLWECDCYGSHYRRYLSDPIPYNFMLWVWDFNQFYDAHGAYIPQNISKAQRILRILSNYVPGMQEHLGERSIVYEAWRAVFDFNTCFKYGSSVSL
ncbi:hypothetical protein FRC12_023821 [Ceratobasidium sp. 428]|nr:hypothetical protein FRC12_023821 [Ceratobasidium sp. 428]